MLMEKKNNEKTNVVSKEDEDFKELCDSFDYLLIEVHRDSATMNKRNSCVVDIIDVIFPKLKPYKV